MTLSNAIAGLGLEEGILDNSPEPDNNAEDAILDNAATLTQINTRVSPRHMIAQ